MPYLDIIFIELMSNSYSDVKYFTRITMIYSTYIVKFLMQVIFLKMTKKKMKLYDLENWINV